MCNCNARNAAAFSVIGSASPRKDLAAKVTGAAEFGIDVHEDGMLSAALVLAPHPEAQFTVAGEAAARAMAGVVAVVRLPVGVAVIADRFWRARKAAAMISLSVTSSPITGVNDASIDQRLADAFDHVAPLSFPDIDLTAMPPRFVPWDAEAGAAAIAAAPHSFEAEYQVPYLAHTTMEPLCCAVRLRDGELLVRGPLQAPEAARDLAAALSGLPLDKVRVEVTFLGGGFGRKWSNDFVETAIRVALASPGHMVKTIWSREQDFAFDQFRPAFMARYRVGLAANGGIIGVDARISGQSINHYLKRPGMKGKGDPTAAMLLVYGVYDFPNKLIRHHAADLQIPVGFWRSVTLSQNAFFCESLIDELASAAHRDPLAYRKALLGRHPRLVAVMERAAAMIDWSKPRRKGIGRGLALAYADNAFCAQAVEVAVKGKRLTLRRIACAIDCGLAIDPAGVEAQISGGIIFGLQAALWGGMPFSDGAPVAANFDSYRMPLLADLPPIAVELIAGSDRPGSVGETGVPAIAPALVNAIANAGGPRIRRLPVSRILEV